jgi:ABC-type amino acid transport substrate-binding protein
MQRRSISSHRPGLLALAFALVAPLLSLGSPTASRADALDDVKSAKKLTVCGVDGLLPYSSSDAKVPGFEVEIARKIAGELGVDAEYTWVTWDALIPALSAKRCDAIIDGMFITSERMKVVNFSRPYYASGETILVRKDNQSIKSLQDLNGKKTGVLAGSVTVQELEKHNIAPLAVYPDQNTIVLELNNGRIDAAYLEAPSAAWVIRNDPTLNIRIVEEYVPTERFNAGVGLRKEDEQLRAAIDKAVLKLRDDGSIKAILAGYKVPYFPIAEQ